MAFEPNPDALHQGILAGGGQAFGGFGSPRPDFFSHGQDPPMNLPLQPAPALGETGIP